MNFARISATGLLTATLLLAQDQTFRGFLPAANRSEANAETKARAVPDGSRMAQYMNFIAGKPHQAGSPRSKDVADYIKGLLDQWGLNAEIETFDVLLPYPKARKIEILSPQKYEAKLKEPIVSEDPNSADHNQLPTYNAYSADGDVTGEVVYANYGIPEDYDWLAKHGIDVKGKIVLTRYGKSWRGIKPKVAAEHGAIACLIYSDPHEDGYFEGDTFPAGPMRPWQGVQRGSVLDMPLYPGDPLTPGAPSIDNVKRLPIADAKSILKIPVLPISYGDAEPILNQLTGPVPPASWRGSLPFTYHAGPGATKIHLKAEFDWSTRPIFDVVATIPGADFPDQWVMVGNHHDAWVNGADDPTSGTVALLETARALGATLKTGWRPRRTLKICFWDGEEFGLIGSTEWVEKHQEELKQKGVAYLNSDTNGRGWLNVSGSHTLETFAAELARSINQPGGSDSLLAAKLNHKIPENAPADDEDNKKTKTFTIGALGAGSDYVAFLDYAGIASMNEGFSGMDRSGIYHSVYDSIYWYNHFSDGSHAYGQALSQFTAAGLMRLADADVLPFEWSRFVQTVTTYVDEIEHEAAGKGRALRFEDVRQQLLNLSANGMKYEVALKTALQKNALDQTRLAELNRTLLQTERALLRPEGLPNRSWYKHQIYAPGFYTGYGVKTLPGVREAVDAKQWDLAMNESVKLAECLEAMNALVAKATEQCQGL